MKTASPRKALRYSFINGEPSGEDVVGRRAGRGGLYRRNYDHRGEDDNFSLSGGLTPSYSGKNSQHQHGDCNYHGFSLSSVSAVISLRYLALMILLVEFLARGPTIATGTSGASTGTSVTYINGTGGTFPFSVYKELIFSYHFVASDTSVSYLADGSGTGKCNIMGFWHTGNIEASSIPSSIKVADQALCTASSRPSRQPLVDFSGSDSVLSEADYSNFPDLQMLPSVAGAVVPIYNIPEIANGGTKSGLALSRSTLAGIFKGTIRYWGDANIIKDVNQSSRSLAVALKRLSKVPINVVVRQDSSGTSEIFSNALASFDPKGVSSPDFSFGALGSAGSTPSWCDPKTDEIQDITFSGCNTTSVGSNEVVDGGGVAYFKIVKPSGGGFADVYIQCNDTIQSLSYRFGNSSIRVFPVSRTVVSEASLNIDGSLSSSSALDGMYSVTFRIAYPYSGLSKTNWYQPAVVTTSEGLSVSIATVQEGGYLNAPYSGTKKTTALTQSVWVLSNYSTTVSAAAMNNASWITFRLSWSSSPVFGSNGVAESSSSHNQSAVINTTSPLTDISSVMKTAITAAHPGAVSSVSRASFKHGWAEYQIVFSSAAGASGIFSSMTANITDASADVQLSGRSAFSKVVHVTKLLDANRYPQFYDSSHPRGYSGSGRYYCYKRSLGYQKWEYFTGSGNGGVVAEVMARPYSIGYAVLESAIGDSLPTARLINKAGYTVTASAESVDYAVMDKGGSMDSRFTASLVDATSSSAWPIVGFTYFIIRTKTHLGDCQRRKEAMEFLYEFYNSAHVEKIANRLGFAMLSDMLKSRVMTFLIDNAMCSDGTYALESYRSDPVDLMSAEAFTNSVQTYLSAYSLVDDKVAWNFSFSDDSREVWRQFSNSPDKHGGVFTLFPDRNEKLAFYGSSSAPDYVLTTAFASVPLVNIYHLNSFTTKTSTVLRLTDEIMAGIYGGSIRYWNDTLIQESNPTTKGYLPYQKIKVVVRSDLSDANAILLKYLTNRSSTFAEHFIQYAINAGLSTDDYRVFNFSTGIESDYVVWVDSNSRVDSMVTVYDGSIGYYLHTAVPTSTVAHYCADASCSSGVIVPNDYGASSQVCMSDPSVVVKHSATTTTLYTYDLSSSTTEGCYPLSGTVDYSVKLSSPTCAAPSDSTTSGSDDWAILLNRLEFGSWLYSSSVLVEPLAELSIAPSLDAQRKFAYSSVCDNMCGASKMGYYACGYRDCSWSAGDYIQSVSPCSESTQTRTVTYRLKSTSVGKCIENPATIPPSHVTIDCSYVLTDTYIGKTLQTLCIIGAVTVFAILVFTWLYRQEKILKQSQLMFIYMFLVGSLLMNLSGIAFIGANSDMNCVLRPWLLNVSSSLMFAPLLMKLHRIDVLYRRSRKLKKSKISDFRLGVQTLALVAVDVFILALWTGLDMPHEMLVYKSGAGVYQDVSYSVCNTGITNSFEAAMVAWKALLLALGVAKSIAAWDKPAEIAEVKHFFLAIYNVSVVGGATYFFSLFGSPGTVTFVLLRVLGIFISATLPVLIIMVPKMMMIQLKGLLAKIRDSSWFHTSSHSESASNRKDNNSAGAGQSSVSGIQASAIDAEHDRFSHSENSAHVAGHHGPIAVPMPGTVAHHPHSHDHRRKSHQQHSQSQSQSQSQHQDNTVRSAIIHALFNSSERSNDAPSQRPLSSNVNGDAATMAHNIESSVKQDSSAAAAAAGAAGVGEALLESSKAIVGLTGAPAPAIAVAEEINEEVVEKSKEKEGGGKFKSRSFLAAFTKQECQPKDAAFTDISPDLQPLQQEQQQQELSKKPSSSSSSQYTPSLIFQSSNDDGAGRGAASPGSGSVQHQQHHHSHDPPFILGFNRGYSTRVHCDLSSTNVSTDDPLPTSPQFRISIMEKEEHEHEEINENDS